MIKIHAKVTTKGSGNFELLKKKKIQMNSLELVAEKNKSNERGQSQTVKTARFTLRQGSHFLKGQS